MGDEIGLGRFGAVVGCDLWETHSGLSSHSGAGQRLAGRLIAFTNASVEPLVARYRFPERNRDSVSSHGERTSRETTVF